MIENTVSASHFRVHFKEIANSVARGEEACTVARHGLEIVALVSLEDLVGLSGGRATNSGMTDRLYLSDP
jgi:prevent-host-death family protein